MGASVRLRSGDGFEFAAYQALPEEAPKAGVVVIQEVFGVNAHIRKVADGYAAAGYASVAPQIFDRVQPGLELGYGEADLERGLEIARQKLQMPNTLADIQAALDHAAQYGRVGVVGYCFGGLLCWLTACELRGAAAAACYYGGGTVGEAQRKPRCPVIMHFGELDSGIPLADVEQIKAAQPEMPVHLYHADHGFNCDHRASYHEASAVLARQRTLKFFARELG